MKVVEIVVLYFFVCNVIGIVLGGSNDEFEDLKEREETLSMLETGAVSPSSPVKPLMVDLTLIEGADSKGAGTPLSYLCQIPVCYWLFIKKICL